MILADTINTSKNRLDTFWKNQNMVYDYKSDLTGIGNKSLTDMDESLIGYTQLYCCYLMDIEALRLCSYSPLLCLYLPLKIMVPGLLFSVKIFRVRVRFRVELRITVKAEVRVRVAFTENSD